MRVLREILACVFVATVVAALPEEVPGPQVVFKVVGEDHGERVVTPVGTVTFSLAPMAGPTSKAPLPDGSSMICRMLPMVDDRGINHVALRCGVDLFGVDKVWVR